MDITEARKNIDKIDEELIFLFEKRMKISAEIAQYKRENNLPVFDEKREIEILKKIDATAENELKIYTENLYKKIFEISRSYQDKLNRTEE